MSEEKPRRRIEDPSITAVRFSNGTVVQMKSGGPMMVVLDHYDTDAVSCTWFDKDWINHTDDFAIVVLEVVDPRQQ